MAKNIPTIGVIAFLLGLGGCQSKGLWTIEARNEQTKPVFLVVEWPSELTPGARFREEAKIPAGSFRSLNVWFEEPPERFRVAVKNADGQEIVRMFERSELPEEQRAPSSLGRTLRLEVGDKRVRFRSPTTFEKLNEAGPAFAAVVLFAGAVGVLGLYLLSLRRDRKPQSVGPEGDSAQEP